MEILSKYTQRELQNGLDSVLKQADEDPVIITRENENLLILMDAKRYFELEKLEDTLLVKAAELAIAEGFVSRKDSDALLDSL